MEMRMGLGAKSGIGWPWPKCGQQVNRTVAWLKENTNYTCERCGGSFAIPSANRERFLRAIEQIDKLVENFGMNVPISKQRH
jgi:predicted RNA-binding Zn-ribbon protein involved in translation (DUF1610 family)